MDSKTLLPDPGQQPIPSALGVLRVAREFPL